jgi:two-component system, NarL family, sensor kinase
MVVRGEEFGVPLWPFSRHRRDPAASEASQLNKPTSPFDDQVPLSRLVLRYVRTAVVTLMIVAVATAYLSRRLATDEAIDEARRVATISAEAAVEPILDDGILTGDPTAIATVDAAVRDAVLRGSLVRVKVWRSDGTILYSDESRLIGERFALDDDELDILRGGEPHASRSDLSDPENRFEDSARELLEVYLPIETPDGTPLLYEAYFRYDGVAEAGQRAWMRFAPLTLGALVLLAVLQVPLALSLGRRLRRTQEQREALLHSAMEATDAERRRIASDLHDGVVQDLAGVAFSLGAAARSAEGDGADVDEVEEAADRVRDSVRSLRSLLVEIYPPNLYEEGLPGALEDLLARLDPRGIDTSLVIDVPDELSQDVTELVYRAAQEALRNVVAHADAARVDVSVTQTDGVVCLEVSDDGRGLSGDQLSEGPGHFGLRALAGLAATMGATLTIDSTPGRGTTLALEVPA